MNFKSCQQHQTFSNPHATLYYNILLLKLNNGEIADCFTSVQPAKSTIQNVASFTSPLKLFILPFAKV
jgi:hypothetical protein